MKKEIITNRTEDHSVLTTSCTEIDPRNEEPVRFLGIKYAERNLCAQVITDLLDTAESVRAKCLGLSANQIGYPVRIFVARVGADESFIPFINPKIVKRGGGVKALNEACLSIVGEDGNPLRGVRRRRSKIVTVQFWDILVRDWVSMELKGFRARVVQHEIDHLNGKLL